MDLKNKKIFLYVNFIKDDNTIGITKKIKAQIKTMRKMGLEVYYTSYVDDGVVIVGNDDEVVYKKTYFIKWDRFKRYDRRFLLIKTSTEFIITSGIKFDFGYLRWHTFDRPYLKMLKALKENGAINIVEAHAWTPDQKYTDIIGRYENYMDQKYSKHAHEYVSLVAAMSDYDNIWGIKTVKVDNAVDLDSIMPRVWIKNEEELRIISVSNEYNYHGYDRLIKGLKNYYDNGGDRQIVVHLVGVFMPSTKRLVEKLQLEKHVLFHGKMFGPALDNLYANSDLGIGALAHHRIGMYSGSSLKTKEYFAKGLPFIYGWKEPAFDESYPYAMKINLDETPLDIPSVLSFYDGIKNDENMMDSLRDFAKKNYSWDQELTKVFQALEF